MVPGPQVLVQLRNGVDVQALAAARGLGVAGQFGKRPIYRLALPAGADMAAVVASLQTEPGVVFAEPDAQSETPEGRRDNTFWAIGRSEAEYRQQWAPEALRLPLAHAMTQGSGVRVAVLDTGIVAAHPAFAGRLLPGRDFVDGDNDPAEVGTMADPGYGHGTHVAGLVALAAPGARIMPVRVLDRAGRGNHWVLAEALAWAVDPDGNPATDDGAHIVNMSLGSMRPTRMLQVATALANCEFDDDDDDFDDPGFDDDRARCALGPSRRRVRAPSPPPPLPTGWPALPMPAAGSGWLRRVKASSAPCRVAGAPGRAPRWPRRWPPAWRPWC